MSQPLTGQVRRRLHEISVYEGWFLLALADMVDSNTKEWREPWRKLANRFGKKDQRRIKQIAYRLRDHGWLSIRSDGRGVVFQLHPGKGKTTIFSSSEVGPTRPQQVGPNGPSQVGPSGSYQLGPQGPHHLTSPSHSPSGGNAPRPPTSKVTVQRESRLRSNGAGPQPKQPLSGKAPIGGPLQEDVFRYAKEQAIPESVARDFFDHFEAKGWHTANGQVVFSWQARLRTWAKEAPSHRKKVREPQEVVRLPVLNKKPKPS